MVCLPGKVVVGVGVSMVGNCRLNFELLLLDRVLILALKSGARVP